MRAGQRDMLLASLAADRESADLAPPDRAMLQYVVKLTLRPADIVEADVEALRAHGFDDRAIHDICSIASYYAFVNRIADGLGVELEPGGSEPVASRPDGEA